MAKTALAPLDKLDPGLAWQPWKPDAKNPFNLKWAGHLHRRAGFGAGLAELRQAAEQGLPTTLDRFLDGQPDAEQRIKFLTKTGELISGRGKVNELRAWWLYCMLHSMYPLREKLTLFWHDHFATSITKVNSTSMMFQQNVILRENALGKFQPFLLAISKDPAMLIWLDSNSNVKGKPNENYAREVMELFSLGVGNYTEKDIQEAARAFTGWHTEGGKFTFNSKQHDDGAKTILNQTGKWNGDDVVRICLEQPVAARFLVRKLYRYFVSEAEVPSDRFLEPLTSAFRKSNYDIKALVRQMLSSRHFFSEYAYRQRIKSPVEYIVGTVWATTDRIIPQAALVSRLESMGQLLFAPPNVKGWPGGTSWLNTSTVLARHNFAHSVVKGELAADENRNRVGAELIEDLPPPPLVPNPGEQPPGVPGQRDPLPPPPPENMDVARLIRDNKVETPARIVSVLLDLLLQGDISAQARNKLIEFVNKDNPRGAALDHRVRETAHMIMTMPEFQLA